jgi:hypothetical protein
VSELVRARLVERQEVLWRVELPWHPPREVLAADRDGAIAAYAEAVGIILSETHIGQQQQITVVQLEQ